MGERGLVSTLARPWQLPARGLAVFHGPGETARLSHYFLPRLLLGGRPVLVLDGANRADPRLLERLARERGVPFERFNRQVRIARAFTCFQLTELIARVPRWLEDFPAEVLIVTGLPELYYDEDVRDWDARVAFERALADLRRWALKFEISNSRSQTCLRRQVAVAVFSAAPTFRPPAARRRFFPMTCAAATEIWEFRVGQDRRLQLCEVRHGSNGCDISRADRAGARELGAGIRSGAAPRGARAPGGDV